VLTRATAQQSDATGPAPARYLSGPASVVILRRHNSTTGNVWFRRAMLGAEVDPPRRASAATRRGGLVPAPPPKGQTSGWQGLPRRSASRPTRTILHLSLARLNPVQPPPQQMRAAGEHERAEDHPREGDDGAGCEPEGGGHACGLRRSRARLASAQRNGSASWLPLFMFRSNSACSSVRRGSPFLRPSHRHPEQARQEMSYLGMECCRRHSADPPADTSPVQRRLAPAPGNIDRSDYDGSED